MTRMTGPDCAVMCNLINTHTHTHSTPVDYINSSNTRYIIDASQLMGMEISSCSLGNHITAVAHYSDNFV